MTVWNRAGRADAQKSRDIIHATFLDIRQYAGGVAAYAYLVGTGLGALA